MGSREGGLNQSHGCGHVSRRILQFGTSRFLQAHADLFVHQAREAGQDIGPITIVKTTNGGARQERVRAFGAPAGFPIHVRGFEKGKVVDETLRVTCVERALDAHEQWAEITRIFADEIEIVFSNVGEVGYRINFEDEAQCPATHQVPRSFPAKLLFLLVRRFERTAEPLLILPCELVNRNGRVLRDVLRGLAQRWDVGWDFRHWLAKQVTICDTLVDRIVSEAIDPIGAVAEPYALWAIQRERGMNEPLQHPNIVYTNDLEPYSRLKLHILNLGHTYIADIWRREARYEGEVVADALRDTNVRARLQSLYDDEVIPGFSAHCTRDRGNRYVVETLERFDNPFLNHRVSDIFEKHRLKMGRHVQDFIDWARAVDRSLALPRLELLSNSTGQMRSELTSQARAGILIDT
jgi:tagaturonate reductase